MTEKQIILIALILFVIWNLRDLFTYKKTKTMASLPSYLIQNCPDCNAALSNWELKERECYSCGWTEHPNPNDTKPDAPDDFEYDREINDEIHD